MTTTLPKLFLTTLDDGTPWLTDGHDFGINADAVPDLLQALKNLYAMGEHQRTIGNSKTVGNAYAAARAAIARAERKSP